MIRKRLASMALAIPIGLAVVLLANPAGACAVCVGGDPSAELNQGLDAGVIVLLGVIGVVLLGFASLFLFWMRRAAVLEAQVAQVDRALQKDTSSPRASLSTT